MKYAAALVAAIALTAGGFAAAPGDTGAKKPREAHWYLDAMAAE
jgi:hypothetical protein